MYLYIAIVYLKDFVSQNKSKKLCLGNNCKNIFNENFNIL